MKNKKTLVKSQSATWELKEAWLPLKITVSNVSQ